MIRSPIVKSILVAFLALLTFFGCVEREEKIRIHEDGSASISVLFKADHHDELYLGRVPAEDRGWNIMESTETSQEGKVKYHLLAETDFAAGAPLPATYTYEGLKDAPLFLHFPTSLKKEKREDGTYYHFRRVYKKRDWAYIALLKEIVPDKKQRSLMDKDPRELPPFEREALLRGMTEIELYKKMAFAREAYLAITPGLPGQDGWLKLFNNVLGLRTTLDYRKLAGLLGREDAASDAALAEAADRFEETVLQKLHTGLRTFCHYDETRERAFFEKYHEKERGYNLSEDIEGESFSITVEMPGEIIGSNANRIEGNKAMWEFNGKALRDRDQELLISSRVSN